MLSIAPVSAGAASTEYYSRESYYTDDGARDSSGWFGRGAEEMGLSGPVDTQRFKEIMDGYTPDGNRIGVMRSGEFVHRPGTDLTFSAPKSVSILALTGVDERLVEAHDRAVRAAMDHMERNHLTSRTRDSVTGEIVRLTDQKMVAGLFRHDLSRALDPQLHTHAVVANMAQGEDGKWRATESKSLMEAKMLGGAIYRAELAKEVRALGYDITVGQRGMFEISGVDPAAIQTFSKRREEILTALDKTAGERDAAAASRAALLTRSAKSNAVNRVELREAWRGDLEARGAGIGHLEALRDQAAGRPHPASALGPATERARPDLLSAAIAVVSERDATWSRNDLAATALTLRPGDIGMAQVDKMIDAAIEKGVLFNVRDGEGRELMTDIATIRAEQRALTAFDEGKGLAERQGSDRSVARAAKRANLNEGQTSAVKIIAGAGDRFVGVQGFAGTGKTTMLNAAKEALRSGGKEMVALAPTHAAVQALEHETGAKGQTLQAFLSKHSAVTEGRAAERTVRQYQEQMKGKVVVVDEASFISTTQMRDLLTLANTLKIERVVLSGDVKQLEGVEAGSPFRALQEHGMKVATLTEIHRQRDQALKQSVYDAIGGKIGQSVEGLGANVRQVTDKTLGAAIAESWIALPNALRETTGVIAPTNAIRREANETIREGLKAEGAITGREVAVDRFDDRRLTRMEMTFAARYAKDDRVIFARDLVGAGIEANTVYRVLASDGRSNRVTLMGPDGKERVFEPSEQTAPMTGLFKAEAMTLAAGDRLRFTRTVEGGEIVNGQRAEVAHVGGGKVTLQFETGERMRLSAASPALHHVDYAWSATAHAFQGHTRDHIIAAVEGGRSPLTNQKTFYVDISRARDSAVILTDDAGKMVQTLEKETGDRLTALEALRHERGEAAPGEQREAVGETHAAGRDAQGGADRNDAAREARPESGAAHQAGPPDQTGRDLGLPIDAGHVPAPEQGGQGGSPDSADRDLGPPIAGAQTAAPDSADSLGPPITQDGARAEPDPYGGAMSEDRWQPDLFGDFGPEDKDRLGPPIEGAARRDAPEEGGARRADPEASSHEDRDRAREKPEDRDASERPDRDGREDRHPDERRDDDDGRGGDADRDASEHARREQDQGPAPDDEIEETHVKQRTGGRGDGR